MNSKNVRKYITGKIKEVTGLQVAFFNANDQLGYPFIEFDLSELTSDYPGKHTMELTVDAWDRDEVKTVEEAIDKLDKAFDCFKDNTDDFVITFYHGGVGQFIPDDDKRIRRKQRTYSIILFDKEM